VDFWPDVRFRIFYASNLPISILLGWYSHPLSIYEVSILGPFLFRLCQRLSVEARVITLDAVLLLGVLLFPFLPTRRGSAYAKTLATEQRGDALMSKLCPFCAQTKSTGELRIIGRTSGLSANLPLPDYGRVARHPTTIADWTLPNLL
jgi:hypothetical protein